jgi:hypothetical protein
MKNETHWRRRTFLKTLGLSGPAVLLTATDGSTQQTAPESKKSPAKKAKEISADLVIIGGGVGGCAAALAALRGGLSVIMTEETDWIGGQLTSQAVPPDENPWIETFGGTRSYLKFRRGVREFYRRHFPLTAEARANPLLNPGNGWVSRLCHEPRVALAVLHEMLAPFVAARALWILTRHRPIAAETRGDRVLAVSVQDLESGDAVVLHAPWFCDATELGDLLPLTKTEFVMGAESQRQTDEPNAPQVAAPENQQSFTCCFAMDYLEGEEHLIDKPAQYDFWKEYVPRLTPSWPGKLLAWEYSDPTTTTPKRLETDPAKATGLFSYRRLIDRSQFAPGTYRGDISLVNWPQNDYMVGNLIGVSAEEAARHLHGAKQLSLSLLYWLQTAAPRPDGGTGWKGLRLREDTVGTADGLAKYPYIRESRRLQAEFTVVEQQVSTEARMRETGAKREEVTATPFSDSVGIGAYRIDLHPSTSGINAIDISSLPFQIPLGALLPKRVDNLLAAGKNLGVTHITNGCYRLHPVEWNIGEAAGALAAFCTQRKRVPREVRVTPALLKEFQNILTAQGVPLAWPKVTPL